MMARSLHGHSLVAGSRSPGRGEIFRAISAIDSQPLPGEFRIATDADANAALDAAGAAAADFRNSPGEIRARLLEAIATGIESLGDELLTRANLETALPDARLKSERLRTVNQLRMFAQIARENAWLEARIETAIPDREPIPKVDLRRMLVPIGPVVVFGASNFPLAYSVAGGDTASALATGNPVVVKAHEAHPGTSEYVAEVIASAIRDLGLPAGIFSLLQGPGKPLGPPLVTHPQTRALGFTGSLTAGRALFDLAAARPHPIPVFAEMGSLNPIVVLPSALTPENAASIAASITQGAGQFCTKPGVILLPRDGSEGFRERLIEAIQTAPHMTMLHDGIGTTYSQSCKALKGHPAAEVVAYADQANPSAAGQALAIETDAVAFLARADLREEVFGPFAVLVNVDGTEEIRAVLHSLGGQLTSSIFGAAQEIEDSGLLPDLQEIAGRIIVNGVPTGVEVCSAMQHGGPFPASTDSRFTAVGPAALRRFVRPICFQNHPDELLPPALQRANPLGIERIVDGERTHSPG